MDSARLTPGERERLLREVLAERHPSPSTVTYELLDEPGPRVPMDTRHAQAHRRQQLLNDLWERHGYRRSVVFGDKSYPCTTTSEDANGATSLPGRRAVVRRSGEPTSSKERSVPNRPAQRTPALRQFQGGKA